MAATDTENDQDPDATRRLDLRGEGQTFDVDATASGTSQVTGERETLPPGARAGQYVISRAIGAGGGGVVYAAEHQLLRRQAAVKVLRRGMVSSPTMVARFLREATTVNVIRHPNIVDIYEFGQLEDGRPYYVMELLEGTDLGKLLKLHGRFSGEEAYELLEPVCRALEAAHHAGIVHRDLKASNVIVAEVAGKRVIKLVDFGIAKLTQNENSGPGLTEPGVLLGSVHAMSPEQVRCEPVDSRSDIYSLGVLLYQLLTGEHPFSARPEQVAWMHLEAPAPRPSQAAPVSPALDAVVLRCLEKDRRQRYQTVGALLDDLRKAVGGESPALGDSEITATAIGCYIEIRLDELPEEDVDDAVLEDTVTILDIADEVLTSEDFILAIHTSNAVLGVKLCPDDLPGSAQIRDRALATARSLRERFAARPNGDARVKVNISVHADEATVKTSGQEREVTGGPILDVERWAANTRID